MSGENQPSKFPRKPNREIFISTSKDGKFCIIKVIESWILPHRYLQTILNNAGTGQIPATDPKDKTKGS